MATGLGELRGFTSETGSGGVAPIGRGQHILFIAAHFAPESTSGTHRSLHFARALVDEGFRVSVVTVDRTSLRSVDPKLDSIFPYEDRILRIPLAATLETTYIGWKQRWLELLRVVPGHKVDARPKTPESQPVVRRGNIRREVAGMLGFPDQFRGWYGPATDAAYRLARADPVDAVFASAPPWTALQVAHKVSQRTGAKLIVDFRDPWTWQMGFSYPDEPKVTSAWAEREEALILADASAVLFNSPNLMWNSIRNRGTPVVVPYRCLLNGTDVPARTQSNSFPTDEPLTFRHFGSLYGGRSVGPLIEALRSTSSASASRVRVELIGPTEAGTMRGLEGGAEYGISVEARPEVPYSEAVRLMAEPAALLVVQSRDFSGQIPTKLYEYLRTGNPIVVIAAETSAVWRFASRFPRCRRLDFDDVAGNRAILDDLVETWADGRLEQERTDVDTDSLAKHVIGREFAQLVGAVLNERPVALSMRR